MFSADKRNRLFVPWHGSRKRELQYRVDLNRETSVIILCMQQLGRGIPARVILANLIDEMLVLRIKICTPKYVRCYETVVVIMLLLMNDIMMTDE